MTTSFSDGRFSSHNSSSSRQVSGLGRALAILSIVSLLAFPIKAPAQLQGCGFCWMWGQYSPPPAIGSCGLCEYDEYYYVCDFGNWTEWYEYCYGYDSYGNFTFCEAGGWEGNCRPDF